MDGGDGQGRIGEEIALQGVLDLAFGYLTRRDRTIFEVRRHLAGKEAGAEVVDKVIEILLEQGYLDDARYAVRFAEDRRALDGWGADRIARRLRSVGVDAELVDTAVSQQGADAEHAAAVVVLSQKFARAPVTDRDRGRALGVLVRKGYDLEVAYAAVRTFTNEAPSPH